MVKPIFKTLNDMRAAETAEQASEIGLAFLSSDDAQVNDDSRAGTFAKALPAIFDKFKAPEVFNAFLESATSADTKASFGLRTALGFAKTDFRAATGYKEEASRYLLNNAKILKSFTEQKPNSFEFAKHYNDKSNETEKPVAYPSFALTENSIGLKMAINDVLMTQDIEGEQVPVFFEAMMDAFKNLKISERDQEDLLAFVQDGLSPSDTLFKLCDHRILILTEDKGPAPASADNGGRAPNMN